MPKPKNGVDKNLFNSKNEGLNESRLVLPKKYSPSNVVVPKETSEEPNIADYPIQLNKVSASWTANNTPEEMTLKNLSLRIRKGKLCAVIGPVGSGKVRLQSHISCLDCVILHGFYVLLLSLQTSLLQLLLRELPVTSGNLKVSGKLSYACQESWLFPGTVRENILFGLPYDVAKYKEV